MADLASAVSCDWEENEPDFSDCKVSAQALIELGRKRSECQIFVARVAPCQVVVLLVVICFSVTTADSASEPQPDVNGVGCDWEENENAAFPDCHASGRSLREFGRKRIERGEVWKYKETKSLLAIWSSNETQHQLSTLRRNKSVWQLIALKLKSAGYRRTWVQCKNRIANLIKLYKKAAKDNNDSSGPFRSAEPFFKELNSTLNNGPTTGAADGCEEPQYTNDCDSLYLVQSALGGSTDCLLEEVADASPRSSLGGKHADQSPGSGGGGGIGHGEGEEDSLSDAVAEPSSCPLGSLGGHPTRKRKRKLNTYHQTMLEQFRLLIGEVEKRFYEFEERREIRWLEELERQRSHEMALELKRLEHESRESKRTEEFFKLICERMNRD